MLATVRMHGRAHAGGPTCQQSFVQMRTKARMEARSLLRMLRHMPRPEVHTKYLFDFAASRSDAMYGAGMLSTENRLRAGKD